MLLPVPATLWEKYLLRVVAKSESFEDDQGLNPYIAFRVPSIKVALKFNAYQLSVALYIDTSHVISTAN